MLKCSNCGAELDSGAKFCMECGTPVPQVKKCPKCSKELPLEAKFCFGCGLKLEGSATTSSGLSLGDKNVIAGDVVGEKVDGDSFSGDKILGNVTHTTYNTTVTDETKSVNTCSICGVHMTNDTGHTCPKCSKPVCSDHFNAVLLCCKSCADKELMGSRERCRVCGRTLLPNQEFICRICHKTVCEKHYDDEMMCCKLCSLEQKKAAEEEAARKAEEEAKRQAEAEARRQAEEEARRHRNLTGDPNHQTMSSLEITRFNRESIEKNKILQMYSRGFPISAIASSLKIPQEIVESVMAEERRTEEERVRQQNTETSPTAIRAEIRKYICERFSYYMDNTDLAKLKRNMSAGLYIDGKTINFKDSKFSNALASYTTGITRNDIVILYDDTAFGSAKEGFIITEDAIFSKGVASAANMVKFKDKPTVSLKRSLLSSDVSIIPGVGTNFKKETLCQLLNEIVTTICSNETWLSVLK